MMLFKRKNKDGETLRRIQMCYNELTGRNDVMLSPKSRLYDRIGLSSLGVVQLICMLEDEFDIAVPNVSPGEYRTVNDLIKTVEKLKKKE